MASNPRKVNLGFFGFSVTYAAKDAKRNLEIVQEFYKVLPKLNEFLAGYATKAAKEIAPFSKHRDLARSIKHELTDGGRGFRLKASPKVNEVKAFMQEYGYPYSNYWGPYNPNPKNRQVLRRTAYDGGKRSSYIIYNGAKYNGTLATKISGVGYLRPGIIVASRFLDSGNEASSYSSISPTEVVNYQKTAALLLKKSLRAMLIAVAKGDLSKLNAYQRIMITTTPNFKMPTNNIQASRTSFGRFSQDNYRVPMRVGGLSEIEIPTADNASLYQGYKKYVVGSFLI